MFPLELVNYFTNTDGILCPKLENIDSSWINNINKVLYNKSIYKLEIRFSLIIIVVFELGNYITNLDEIL